jgi:hypothetical protein
MKSKREKDKFLNLRNIDDEFILRINRLKLFPWKKAYSKFAYIVYTTMSIRILKETRSHALNRHAFLWDPLRISRIFLKRILSLSLRSLHLI